MYARLSETTRAGSRFCHKVISSSRITAKRFKPTDLDAVAAESILNSLYNNSNTTTEPPKLVESVSGQDPPEHAPHQEQTAAAAAAMRAARLEKIARARALAEAAAERGCARGRTILASLYRDGIGAPPNIEQAKHLFSQAADAGDPYAKLALGSIIVQELTNTDVPPTIRLRSKNPYNGSSNDYGIQVPRSPTAVNENRGEDAPQLRGKIVVDVDKEGEEITRMFMEVVDQDGRQDQKIKPETPAQVVRRVRKNRRNFGHIDQTVERFENHDTEDIDENQSRAREQAMELLTSALEENIHEAGVALGNLLIRDDPRTALKLYETAAKEGHVPGAHYNIGLIYYDGRPGIEPDQKLALKHFLMAAQLGEAQAQFFIAHVYRVGDFGVKPNEDLCLRYTQLAVAQDHAGATHYLALMHLNGECGLKPCVESFRSYLDLACDLGSTEAFICRADMYFKGTQGMSVDHAKALENYMMAALAGETSALCSAAAMYVHGFGTKRDYHKAFELYQEAAVLGDTTALKNLGVMYYHGQGVAKSVAIAEYFFKIAEASETSDAGSVAEEQRSGIRWEEAPHRSTPHSQKEADELKPKVS